jgi:ribokinase
MQQTQQTQRATATGPVSEPGGVVVVGSISVDVTAFTGRLPAPGETVLGDAVTLVLGGKGANQAVAAARAGARTSIVGCVGSDPFRDIALGGLTAEGVDTTAVATLAGATGVAHIRVDASGENDIVMVPLANASLTPDRVEQALATVDPGATVLLLQLEVPHEAAQHAARLGRDRGLTVVLDPAPAPSTPFPDDFWATVDVVTPNETEARLITGVTVTDVASAEQAGRWFVDRGVGRAVVTLAGQGALVVTADAVTRAAPYPVQAVDTTAAGDAFAGHLGAALAVGLAWDEAVRRAMAAGALAVTVAGASPSLPTAAAVDAFLGSRDDEARGAPRLTQRGQ